MRRKTKARTRSDEIDGNDETGGTDELDDAPVDVAPAANDHDEFWAGPPGRDAEHLETLAGVIDSDEQEMDDDTLEYMGSVPRTRVDPDELVQLADWAESKACRICRKRMQETHDPATVKHPNCRSALRVERILRRYT